MNWVYEYWDHVLSGKIAACEKIKAVYKRETGWIEHAPGDFPYYFDEKMGEHHIDFIEKFCKQSKGKWAGKPLELQLFQKAKLQLVFGWREKETGARRIREVVDIRGRKCGKSVETAAVELDMLIDDREGGAEIYCTANKKEQARIIFDEAANMRLQSPEIKGITKKRQSDIYFPATFGYIKALAAETRTMDGLNAHFFSLDEFHEATNGKLYDIMLQSQSAREQPIAWLISTNGFVREGFFDSKYEYAAAVALWMDGYEDYELLPLIHELDSREEWTDPECWEKANPGLGAIKSEKTLARHVEKAKKDPQFLPTVLAKDFNLPENEARTWMNYQDIKNDEIAPEEYLRHSYAIGGCDLSSTTDLTCATLLIRKPNDDKFYVLQKYFLPEARVKAIDESDKTEAPYRRWAEKDYMEICAGATVNYHAVTEWFAKMVREFDIRPLWIGYDAALSGYWVPEMTEYGFDMERIRQGPFTWSYSMKQMGGALQEKKVVYQKNPVLRWCLFNTCSKSTNKDGIETIQPIRASSKRRIDGMVSLLNAWVCYNNHVEDFLTYVR